MPGIDRKRLPNAQYSPVRGLAALLQGIDQERNRRIVEKQVDWKDPSRAVTPGEAERMGYETVAKGIQGQMMFQNPSNTYSLPAVLQMLQSYPGANQGISPATGAVPTTPAPASNPTAVNRSGAVFGSLRNQMKQQMVAAQQAGAVGYDDQLQAFVDANGNPVA